jgi:leucyl aminopeptidase
MWDMKGDMGGAAAVTGAMRAIAGRKAKANVIGIVGLVENMPDAAATRPCDIIKSADGQTIEVQNTDAEGRLVLVDALWYGINSFKPCRIIDLATLTGAILVALGQENAGLFSNDDHLANDLTLAGKLSGEEVWRLPLGSGYDKLIDTPNADMKNIGGPFAGSITAAQFLKRFVGEVPWAHIDIAGMAWKDKRDDPRESVWATGFGVRLLDRFIAENHES